MAGFKTKQQFVERKITVAKTKNTKIKIKKPKKKKWHSFISKHFIKK